MPPCMLPVAAIAPFAACRLMPLAPCHIAAAIDAAGAEIRYYVSASRYAMPRCCRYFMIRFDAAAALLLLLILRHAAYAFTLH